MHKWVVLLIGAMTLIGVPARADPVHILINVLCKSRSVVENHMDLMEAEGGPKSSLITLEQDVTHGECVRFPSPRSMVVDELFEYRQPFKINRNHSMMIRLARIGRLWTIDFLEVNDT